MSSVLVGGLFLSLTIDEDPLHLDSSQIPWYSQCGLRGNSRYDSR
jgi:hypothetical protein